MALQAQRLQMQEAALQDTQRSAEEAQGKRRCGRTSSTTCRCRRSGDRSWSTTTSQLAQARGLEEARQAMR